jgi:hypothetical protein
VGFLREKAAYGLLVIKDISSPLTLTRFLGLKGFPERAKLWIGEGETQEHRIHRERRGSELTLRGPPFMPGGKSMLPSKSTVDFDT